MTDSVSKGAHKVLGGLAGVITGLVVIAIVAVIFSSRSNTAGAIGAGGNALSGIIGAAVQPVGSGGSISQDFSSATSGSPFGSSFAPSSYSSPQSNIPPFGSSAYGPGTGLTYPGPAGGYFT